MAKSPRISIQEANAPAELKKVHQLLWNYGASRGFDAAMGNFQYELDHLPYRYARPEGCLLLAKVEGIPAGCVAYQALENGICEMKRLYVEPSHRGLGLGKALIDQICKEAKIYGYKSMRLDTFDYYKSAIAAYKKAGFYEIPPYQKYDFKDVLFFEKSF